MPNQVVTVDYVPVDELPGGAPMVLAVSPDGQHLDVLMSRAASVDEIAAAFQVGYAAMSQCSIGLLPVAVGDGAPPAPRRATRGPRHLAAVAVLPLTGCAWIAGRFVEAAGPVLGVA